MPSAPDAPRLYVKDGVKFTNQGPGGCRILSVVAIAPLMLGFDITISCGEEGHNEADPHTGGDAWDLRTKDKSPLEIIQMIAFFKAQLGADFFTVLFEVPESERATLDPALLEYIYQGSDPNEQHLHLQTRKGTIFPAARRP